METAGAVGFDIPRNWTFKTADIASGFDRHVREQLPWYDLTTGVVSHVARHYIPDGGLVYDIGCSTGNIGKAIAGTLEDRGAKLVGVDNSEAMRAKYEGPGEFVCAQAEKFDYQSFDVAILFLSLMFVPVDKRRDLMDKLRCRCRKGGVIVVFDRCNPTGGYPSLVLSRLTLAGKIASGVPANEVLAKEISLIGVQRPIDPKVLGEHAVEVFRFGDFAGWLIEG
jgi:tRNA (cmo5U34)-methyltransferase